MNVLDASSCEDEVRVGLTGWGRVGRDRDGPEPFELSVVRSMYRDMFEGRCCEASWCLVVVGGVLVELLELGYIGCNHLH